MSEPMPALSSGQDLDQRFTLVRSLGRGGMAEVWLVHDAELGEDVVAKILPSDASEERVALLRRECREARRLVHPGIARVFEFHRTIDRAFMTMEFVDGQDIGDLRGRSLEEILPVALTVAGALGYAHSHGVVHRDLKIANVVRDATGEARLIDFGIAGLLEGNEVGIRGGGSPHSMSPQQLAGEEPRPSDDIYSFGVLLYELTTGHPPFWPEISERRIRDETPAPMSAAGKLPDGYRSLVDRLLAKDPTQRPPDMATIEGDLRRIRDDHAGLDERGLGSDPQHARLNPPPRVKTIEPIRLRPASQPTDSVSRRSIVARLGIPMALAAIAVSLLLFVFVLLPQWAPSPADLQEEEGVPAAPAEIDESLTTNGAPPPTEDLQERAYRKQLAEQALGRMLELREDFERRGVAVWGGKEYAAAVAHADAGDAALGSADYEAARAEYEQANRLLNELGSQAVEVLRRALADGEQALAAGDEPRATAAFALAAEIAPANQTAAAGLRRAQVVDEVAELLAIAGVRERASDWVEAERAYRQAVALDPMSLPAQESLARVQAHISDDVFAGFMSRGLAALQLSEYDEARQAFERAASIRPDSSQVAEGLLQVDEAEKLDAFVGHRTRAMELEASEEWEAAAEQYEAVIRLAPNVAFARQGGSRCRLRADLARRMAYHLDHPNRLSSDEVYAEVAALVNEASEVDPAGPRHLGQLERLESLLETAGTFVPIRLESDNLTQIMVYRVGRLGTFLEHELELRPGRYTVVGTRKGYRDVRHELVVVAGDRPRPVLVRCEEKI
jgi:serine/threonine protein kinase